LAPLVTAAGAGNALAGAFIDHLVDVGVLVRHGPGHALPEHAPTLAAARTQSVTQLFAAIRDRPLAPPRLDDAAAAAGVGTSELQRLLQHGELVQCGEFGFAADAVAEAVDALRRLEAATGPFTAAQAKEAWATTRRYAIPLLEHLDTAGVTRFDGRHRRVVGALRPSTVDRR
jgi:selenocysteine-specific elongation factor